MIPDFSPPNEALLQLAQMLRDHEYSFTTVTPLTHQRVNSRPENALAKDLRGVFGWSRPFRPDILPTKIWELMQRAEVVERCGEDTYKSTVRLSSLDGQLFLHSAFPTTADDSVFFGPDTYRYANAFRQWFATNDVPVRRAVDIGCGSGAGAILTALQFPDAEVFAGDINEQALRFSRINAALAGARNLQVGYSDLLNGVEGEFDLIIANPPYLVDASERAYRHGGGPLGAEFSLRIVRESVPRLARGGTLLLYTGVAMTEGRDPFREEIEKILDHRSVSWTYRESDPDVFGEELESGVYTQCDRIAAVVLTVQTV